MIRNYDRSGWIGASDTVFVMGSWDTKTFRRWWAVKLGINRERFKNIYTQTGTHLEHKILDYLGVRRRDRQIRLRDFRLRVNLDGEDDVVHEIKTHKSESFKLSRAYWMQAQVEAFASGKPVVIEAYRLTEEDYRNWFLPIEAERLSRWPVEYEPDWIRCEYLPRLRRLAECLRKGVLPNEITG